jgi:hypothetical protein
MIKLVFCIFIALLWSLALATEGCVAKRDNERIRGVLTAMCNMHVEQIKDACKVAMAGTR